ncbi:exported hypothetical protein [Verrucomicrobia bacterium]|nr:exported hypothetical protein [Verrucomicrobiota bacterium]
MEYFKLVAALLTLAGSLAHAEALGTDFSYQGHLSAGGVPANGNYDLTFALFNTNTGGSQVGSPLTNAATPVSNGLFGVTLDFGSGVFTGSNLWLQIGVRTNGATVAFTVLSPRQAMLAVPYALYALTPAGPPGSAQDREGERDVWGREGGGRHAL